MVEVYGQSFHSVYGNKEEKLFFHGISREMLFNSTYARFCGPTSTTTAISVAINFGGNNGIILELLNDGNVDTFFFNCTVLSTFSNEEERLFIGGYTLIPFVSIRHLALNQNYGHFIRAMTVMQYMAVNFFTPYEK